jgi:hypothetical protein
MLSKLYRERLQSVNTTKCFPPLRPGKIRMSTSEHQANTSKETRFPPKPRNQTWPPRSQQTTVPTNATIPVPAPPMATPPAYPQPPSTALKKLTVEERQRCIEQGLCFRCRQPGHSVANFPQPDNRSKTTAA